MDGESTYASHEKTEDTAKSKSHASSHGGFNGT